MVFFPEGGLRNISEASKAVHDKLISPLSPQDFVLEPGGTMLTRRTPCPETTQLPWQTSECRSRS